MKTSIMPGGGGKMFDNDYSRIKILELAKKIGDPEIKLLHLASVDRINGKMIKFQIDHDQWRDIKTTEEVARRVDRIEEIVNSDEDFEYYQMLLLFRKAFLGVMKLSIINPEISTEIVDQYVQRLEDVQYKIDDRHNIMMMRD